MVTSAADLGDHQTKPNNAYLPLNDIPFWKRHTKDITKVTSAADLADLQAKPILQTFLWIVIFRGLMLPHLKKFVEVLKVVPSNKMYV